MAIFDRRYVKNFDWVSFLLIIVLATIGLMLYSALHTKQMSRTRPFSKNNYLEP
jgi:hypothetical protein